MTLDEKISQVRTLIASRDDIDRQIAALLSDGALLVPKPKKRGKKAGHHRTEKDLVEEVEQRQGRSKLDPEILSDEDMYGFFLWGSGKHWEIIGNIYENPELLK